MVSRGIEKVYGCIRCDVELIFIFGTIMTPSGRKKIRIIVGVIFWGVVSSAIWDALKPAAVWSAAILMEISTLGLESMRDAVYLRGRGSEDLAWIQASVQATTCMTLLIFSLGVLCARLAAPTPSVIKVSRLALPPVMIVLMFFWIQYAQTIYVSSLVRYRIDLELMANVDDSDREIKARAAQVRQIKDRKSYILYTQGLSQLIRQRGQQPPEMQLL